MDLQLSQPSSSNNHNKDVLSSYQQQQQQSQQHHGDEIGPGVSKILEKQRLEDQERKHIVGMNGEETMRRRTRFCYMTLGVVLLIVYLVLLKKHFFQNHHVTVPFANSSSSSSSSETQADQLFAVPLDLEGKSKRKEKEKDVGLLRADEDCNDGRYSKRTLQRAYDLPFSALFKDTKGQKKYEASDVIVVDGDVYAVCDNSWAISKFGDDLIPFSLGNKQIGEPHRETEDSGFEALFYDDGTFYVLRESVLLLDDPTEGESEGGSQSYHAIIEELEMGEDDYQVKMTCASEFEFEGDSKGFEGVISLRDTSKELVVLGLCEGNHCSESKKFDVGNGVFVAMKKGQHDDDDDGSCEWKTIKQIPIPPTANFRDYSAATIDDTGRVAISSQEESAIWIGQLLGRDDDTGLWDLEALKFDPDVGVVYTFPKDDSCHTIYCNIEGIHWINEEMIIAVSDKMKSKGKQDYRCFDKDQSVHVFVLP